MSAHSSDRPRPSIHSIPVRSGRDPTRLLQILIDAQDLEGWLPARCSPASPAPSRCPSGAGREGVAGFWPASLHPAGRSLPGAGSPTTSPTACSATPSSFGRPVPQAVDRARPHVRGRPRQRHHHLMHRPVRPGPGDACQWPAIGQLSHRRINEIAELIRQQRPIELWPAEYFQIDDNIRRRDAPPRPRHAPAPHCRPPWPAGARLAGRDAGLQPVRRGGAVSPPPSNGPAPRPRAPGGPKVIVVCNADEGRARHVQRPRAPQQLRRPRLRGMSLAAWAVGASQGFLVSARRIPLPAARSSKPCRPARRRPVRHRHPRPGRLRFRHRHPPGRRRLSVRRRIRPHRIPGRQARHSAHPPALPGHQGATWAGRR